MANLDFENAKKKVFQFLGELLSTKALTLAELEIEELTGIRRGQSRHVAKMISTSKPDSFLKFPNLYGRKTTLAGIWMFLEKDHQIEYLTTAFGKRKSKKDGGPAQYYGLTINHGGNHNVRISESCADYVKKYSTTVKNAEILICHNHPDNLFTNILESLIDWSPLPSNADREIMYHYKSNGIINWLTNGKHGSIKFYLVEKGRLREIIWPSLERIKRILNFNIDAYT